MLAISATVVLMGLAYGASAHAAGFPVWQILMLATLVLAGASELLFVGLVASGAGVAAAVVAGLVVNIRNAAYGATAARVVGGRFGWLSAHLANDETAAFALAQPDRTRARAAYLLSGLGVLLAWPLGAGAGALLGSVVADPSVLGLDAVLPAVLFALAVPSLRDVATVRGAAVGGVIAVLALPFLPAGIGPVVALTGLAVAIPWWRRVRLPHLRSATRRQGEVSS